MSRRLRWLIAAGCVTACASVDAPVEVPSDDDPSGLPEPSPVDGGLEAAPPEADAGPCADCEYFPETCSADTLCPIGPFEPGAPGGAFDSRWTINVIRGRSANDVWAAGAVGALAHFDGTSWRRSDLGSRESLHALWLNDPGEVAFATLSRAYTRGLNVPNADAGPPSDGGWTFTRASTPSELPWPSNIKFGSAWAAPGGRWLWSAMRVASNLATGLWRMRLSPSGSIEVQSGVPTATCTISSCTSMKGIHGVSADELWAVGESGSAVLVTDAEGDSPSVKTFNTRTWNALNAVWVASASEAWAVGSVGTIRHYTGDPLLWSVVSDVPTQGDLRAVWGSSSNDIWAVGDAGVVLHYDGQRWSRVKVAGLGTRRPDLATAWVSAPGHVWVGGQGVILSLGGKP